MLKTETYQRRINGVLHDKEFKDRGMSCIVSPAGYENEEQMFTHFWYFTFEGQKVGMPELKLPAFKDLKGIRGMARDVVWHHDEYNAKYGKKQKGWLKGLFS